MALEDITPATRLEEFIDRVARAAASPNLPEVDASDNGDVLTVVSGEWAAAAPAGGLPEVTSDDNGDVLTVVSGEWAAAAPSGTDNFMMIHSVQSGEPGSYIYTLDKTYNEIKTALLSDKCCYIIDNQSDAAGDLISMATVQRISSDGTVFQVIFTNQEEFVADSGNSYPHSIYE